MSMYGQLYIMIYIIYEHFLISSNLIICKRNNEKLIFKLYFYVFSSLLLLFLSNNNFIKKKKEYMNTCRCILYIIIYVYVQFYILLYKKIFYLEIFYHWVSMLLFLLTFNHDNCYYNLLHSLVKSLIYYKIVTIN